MNVCGDFCVLPFGVLQQNMQFTPISRQDFRIHERFQCVQYYRFQIIQSSLQRVYLLAQRQIHTLPHLRTETGYNQGERFEYTATWCVTVRLTLCCSMASRALNSNGRDCACDASCGASSRTNQRSKLSPRKSNTSKDSGVTMAFKDWKKHTDRRDILIF